MDCVNLIPLQRRQAKATKAHTIKLVSALAAYGAALLVAYYFCDCYAASDSKVMDAQTRRATVGFNTSNLQVTRLTQELAQAQQKLQTAQAVGKQPDWSTLMTVLSEKLGDNAVLDLCRLQKIAPVEKPANEKAAPDPAGADSGSGGQLLLVLGGVAKTQSDVSEFALRLEQTGLFDQVKLVRTNRQTNGTAVAFQVECTLLEGEKTQ